MLKNEQHWPTVESKIKSLHTPLFAHLKITPGIVRERSLVVMKENPYPPRCCLVHKPLKNVTDKQKNQKVNLSQYVGDKQNKI